MSRVHNRAARREREAAELLGSSRVHRSRFERAPDIEPVTLPCGVVLSVEVKTRASLPALLRKAFAQAKSYGPADSVPVAIVSATRGQPIICLPLRDFCSIAGLAAMPPRSGITDPLSSESFRYVDSDQTPRCGGTGER